MARKLTINASQEQLNTLYTTLKAGTPITIALQYVGISLSTYYYWVAVASVVTVCKEQDELEKIEKIAQSGVSLQMCRDVAANESPNRKLAMGTFIEPSEESILQYRNNGRFRRFANEVYEIINACNKNRSEAAIRHLSNIVKSTTDKHINASGSMWFLERTMGDYFGKPADKAKMEEEKPNLVQPITVEFVDPNTVDSKNRLMEMEQQIIKEMKGTGDA